jgi:NADH-quinone oxidoreductase subunit M
MEIEMISVWATIGGPLLAGIILTAAGTRLSSWAKWIAGAGALISLLGTVVLLPVLQAGRTPTLGFDWLPQAGIRLGLRVDWLTFPFLLTEAAIALLAVIFAWGYHKMDERTSYFYALLMFFAVGMAGTTVADDIFLFYVFWEMMLVASYLLILIWGDGPRRTAIAFKYFLFTHFGSLMVLAGFLVLYDASGSDHFSALRAGVELSPNAVTSLIVLFLVGFGIKMAIFPMHVWLPDAHAAAPMPVTIMLAAAMLAMGVYGIMRFPFSIFSLEQLAPFAVPMMVVGVISEIYGALMALAARHIKRIIAYSSVSQMGYILYGLGTLTHAGISGASLHVVYHAIVKALLFMCVGLVIHATGRNMIDEIRGLGKAMPLTTVCTMVGAMAIAGVPALAIFGSKWMIFAGGFLTDYPALAFISVLGSLLTVAYVLWFVGNIFFGDRPEGLSLRPLPHAMIAPTVILTALTLIAGFFPAPVFDWIGNQLLLILGGVW